MPENENVEMFSHRTALEEVANKIIEDGFKFNESFQKTTDQIVDDIIHIRYWDTLRKHYGGYIIVLGIANNVFNRVLENLKSKSEVQQALSRFLKHHDNNTDHEFAYLLPKQYVKGYINRETSEIVKNPDYNPEFIPEWLDQNIDFLNNQ